LSPRTAVTTPSTPPGASSGSGTLPTELVEHVA
jgi:hypothetical protein